MVDLGWAQLSSSSSSQRLVWSQLHMKLLAQAPSMCIHSWVQVEGIALPKVLLMMLDAHRGRQKHTRLRNMHISSPSHFTGQSNNFSESQSQGA